MPKETFFHLPLEKQQRIMKAAKKEFSKSPLAEASIAKIIKDADIPRGSFYQYFEDKEDLYFYYFRTLHRNSRQELLTALQKAQGDLFLGVENYFSKLAEEVIVGENAAFYQHLFLNLDYRSFHKVAPYEIKNAEELKCHSQQETTWQECFRLIDTTHLKVKSQRELEILMKMLMHIGFSTIAEDYRLIQQTNGKSVGKFMADFTLKIDWLKNGVWEKAIENSNK